MHFAVDAHAVQHIAAVGLEGAAVIVQPHAGHKGDKPVGNVAGQIAGQFGVLAILAPAGNNVVAFVQLGHEAADIGGIILQIAVHRHDDVAPRIVDARHEGGRLAAVARQMDNRKRLVSGGQLVKNFGAAVLAAVVDQQQFIGRVQLARFFRHPGVEFAHVVALVVDGNDDGNHGTPCAVRVVSEAGRPGMTALRKAECPRFFRRIMPQAGEQGNRQQYCRPGSLFYGKRT